METTGFEERDVANQDGREYYLTGNSERVNRGYAGWLGQFGHVSAGAGGVR